MTGIYLQFECAHPQVASELWGGVGACCWLSLLLAWLACNTTGTSVPVDAPDTEGRLMAPGFAPTHGDDRNRMFDTVGIGAGSSQGGWACIGHILRLATTLYLPVLAVFWGFSSALLYGVVQVNM